MGYEAPLGDIACALRSAGLPQIVDGGGFPELSHDLVEAILAEAARFAAEEIAPLNRVGDTAGAEMTDGTVTMPPGWRDVYRRWADAGWNGVSAPPEHGGQGLPIMVATALGEMWNAASMAFGIGPVLTAGAIEALHAHADEATKARYLAKLVSGEWTATMNLTEPQAGSDLALLRTRAEPHGDGTYRLRGTKIFITYGEHDLTDNIVHTVLARLPDAPPGTKGISLFLVPKVLPDGSRNDVRCVGLERKLGIHASPTCTMSYGEAEGAVGWLIGEENRGLACMFTMMNNARLAVGVQGLAIAERAYQQALAYARERRQGRMPGMGPHETVAIAEHPDIRRSLTTMRALTGAARSICYATAHAIDLSRSGDAAVRAQAQARANLLTPVAKAFATGVGVEVASLGVQVHGGMGYIEETGAAQHLRDARIAPIYEGTNGIQSIDLVARKIGQDGGAAMERYLAEMRDTARAVAASNDPAFGRTAARLSAAVDALESATTYLRETLEESPATALAGATPYMRLFGLVSGGAGLARQALAQDDDERPARVRLTRFFADNLLPESSALADVVTEGGESLLESAEPA